MNEQIQAQKPRQRSTIGPIIFMITGIIFLAASIFIRATGVGSDHGLGSYYHTLPGGGFESIVPGPLVALDTLSIPSIPIGVTLFLIGWEGGVTPAEGCINRIATCFQDVQPGLRCQVVRRSHHSPASQRTRAMLLKRGHS